MPRSTDPGAKPRKLPPKPAMVDWYSLRQLAGTGARTLVSTVLGSNIDTRRLMAADGGPEESVFDYRELEAGAPFSVAYLADTGDGWASTYTLAYLMTVPELTVSGEAETLPAAEVLVFGGDQIYPVASPQEYRRRLLDPFAAAARAVRADRELDGLPIHDLFAIPGNHDWYDSLASMSQRFFAYRHPGEPDKFGHQRTTRRLGQFRLHQPRSYFVLRLPGNWEVWALDIQLLDSIDTEQQAFFAWHARSMAAGTRVVLCCSVPSITYAKENLGDELAFGLKRIRRLVWQKGGRTCIHIAGDIHNYQRYVTREDTRDKEPYERHHVTCGGGGAFLHPTHSFARSEDRIEPERRYPERDVSRRLARRIPLFAWRHPGMSLLFGLLYAALLRGVPWREPAEIVGHFLAHPLGLVLPAVLVGALVLFAGPGQRLWGLLHGAGHLAMAVAAAAAGDAAAALSSHPTMSLLLDRLVTLGVGAAGAGTLFGIYLWASLAWRRVHHNEAFSTLAWPHHKSFVRFTVEEDGSLTMRACGVERTAGAEGPHPVEVHLIEKIVIPGE